MNAVDVLKQSFNFYRNNFYQLIALGMYIAGATLLNKLAAYIGVPNPLTALLSMLAALIGPLYLILYVHQVSQDGNHAFSSVFGSLMPKLWPFFKTAIYLSVLGLVTILPQVMILNAVPDNKVLIFCLAAVLVVFVLWALYRMLMFTYVVLLGDQAGSDALVRSYKLSENNSLLRNCALLYFILVAAIYVCGYVLASHWGGRSLPLFAYDFLIDVFFKTFVAVFLYRVYTLVNEERPLQAMTLDFAAQPQNAAENQPEQAPETQAAAQAPAVSGANNPDVNTADIQSAESSAADNNKPEPK